MLYEVITKSCALSTSTKYFDDPPILKVVKGANSTFFWIFNIIECSILIRIIIRITSYNVCYTKLLRIQRISGNKIGSWPPIMTTGKNQSRQKELCRCENQNQSRPLSTITKVNKKISPSQSQFFLPRKTPVIFLKNW